jgi:hypothetical protein
MQHMVKDDLTRTLVCLTLGALSVLGLAGCAAPGASVPGEYPDVSLAKTKSPAQLLRNEAAARLPEGVIDEIIESEDSSVACLSEAEDPTGSIRSWHSTVDVLILGEEPVAPLVNALVDSFGEQGWVARDLGGNANAIKKLLETEGSLADMQISGFTPTDSASSVALEESVEQRTVQIEVHGPCVRTAGAESSEVTSLQK